MKKSVGLYTEIIVTISLLLVAALLFTGFLLVRLTEQELLDQRVASVVGTTHLLARSFYAGYQGSSAEIQSLKARADSLAELLAIVPSLNNWGLVDRDLNPQPLAPSRGGYELDLAELSRVREDGSDLVTVHFPSAWHPFGSQEQAFVRVTSAVTHQGRFMGALQGQFSLEDVRLRVIASQRLVFVYTLVYGLLLLLFGAYLLNRTVAKPVRRLKTITAQVAAGDLDHSLPVAGPREISQVATSFNQMLVALKSSRQQTQESIDSLQAANHELRTTRDELIRTEKMASVGQLAAGMAHEVGNPLGATIGYLELLKDELEAGRLRDLVVHALNETDRIDRLVRDLLDYAEPSGGAKEPVDLTELTRETCALLEHQGVFKNLTCRLELPHSLPCASVARHKIQQVIVNLLLNARDASSSGGTILLQGGEDRHRVWLAISDEGMGIAPAEQTKLFDPFFTTKPPGAGRGLGLSVCHRVIEESGGQIAVASAEGRGSRFTIWLPKMRVGDETN